MPEMTAEQQQALQEKIKKMSPEELKQFQKQQCIFCQIVAGKVPAKKVYDDPLSIAILDINPAVRGHLLIIPKEHYAIMPQVPEKEISQLFVVAKYLSQVLLKTLKATGTNVFVANGLAAGQKSQHFMVHLIPRKEGDGVMSWDEKLLDPAIRSKVQQLVEGRFNELMGVKTEIVRLKEKTSLPLNKKEAAVEKEPEDESAEEDFLEKSEDEDVAKSQKPARKPKKKKSMNPPPEEDKTSTPKTEEADDQGVSLDDIANLFK